MNGSGGNDLQLQDIGDAGCILARAGRGIAAGRRTDAGIDGTPHIARHGHQPGLARHLQDMPRGRFIRARNDERAPRRQTNICSRNGYGKLLEGVGVDATEGQADRRNNGRA